MKPKKCLRDLCNSITLMWTRAENVKRSRLIVSLRFEWLGVCSRMHYSWPRLCVVGEVIQFSNWKCAQIRRLIVQSIQSRCHSKWYKKYRHFWSDIFWPAPISELFQCLAHKAAQSDLTLWFIEWQHYHKTIFLHLFALQTIKALPHASGYLKKNII